MGSHPQELLEKLKKIGKWKIIAWKTTAPTQIDAHPTEFSGKVIKKYRPYQKSGTERTFRGPVSATDPMLASGLVLSEKEEKLLVRMGQEKDLKNTTELNHAITNTTRAGSRRQGS